MVSGSPDDIILSPGKPTRPRMGFFRWLLSAFGMSKREPWSLTVGPYQVGIVIWDGAVMDIFSEGTQKLPEGDVQTFVATTAPVKFTHGIRGTGESSNEFDIVLDPPPLTSDGQHATGRIDLTVSVMAQGSRFASVIPEKADRLLQLLGLSGDVVKNSDVARMIKGELSPRLLALDLRGYSADDLRNNQERVRDISNSLKTELTSALDRFGLQLDDFYINWTPQHPQKASSTKRSARDSRPERPKTRKEGWSSSTRRQPVSERKTNKTVMQRLDESGLFNNGVWQETKHYKVSFQVKGRRGASVFVTHDESEFLISNRALKDGKFPDSETLRDFLLSHAHGTVRGKAKISAEHIEAFIDLIRSGLQENPKSRQAIRSSPTRRQPASRRATRKTTVDTSIKQQLEGSGLFDDGNLQKNGSVSYQVTGAYAATIYVTKNEREIHIRNGALQKNRFQNQKLYDFVRSRAHGTAHGKGNSAYAFRLGREHVAKVIELIRSGLHENSKSRRGSLSSQTRSRPASARTTSRSAGARPASKSTGGMSAKGQLRASRLFEERPRQQNGTVSFQVTGWTGATIYVTKNERALNIIERARFPNNESLHDFVRKNKRRMIRGGTTCDLDIEHTAEIIRIIRAGL